VIITRRLKMNKEDWLRAIKCSKEELIEWLNEMYEDEERLKQIIEKYEDNYNVGLERIQEEIYNPKDMNKSLRFYTKVTAKNFEYKRNW
jgi:hypothetical protein